MPGQVPLVQLPFDVQPYTENAAYDATGYRLRHAGRLRPAGTVGVVLARVL